MKKKRNTKKGRIHTRMREKITIRKKMKKKEPEEVMR
jgi:hypothetical protein